MALVELFLGSYVIEADVCASQLAITICTGNIWYDTVGPS